MIRPHQSKTPSSESRGDMSSASKIRGAHQQSSAVVRVLIKIERHQSTIGGDRVDFTNQGRSISQGSVLGVQGW